MNMRNVDATSRMENHFISYHALLRWNGLGWLLD